MLELVMDNINNVAPQQTKDPKPTIEERDQLFLLHAKTKGYIFDAEKGIIYNRHHVEIGTPGKRAHLLFFMKDRKGYGITRSRAIWLHVHGFVPKGVMPSHKSENKFDDCISNLELKSTSERSKKAMITKEWIINTRENCASLTLDLVNWARKEALKPEVSYTQIKEKIEKEIGKPISKPTIIFAVQGKTFKDAKEPPVLHKPTLKKKKTVRVRNRKVKEPKTQTVEQIEVISQTNDSIILAKSLLKNNFLISDKGVNSLLQMRGLALLSSQKISAIRKSIKDK